MRYTCLKQELFSRGDYFLRPVGFDDMEPIRKWRNAQMDVLRQQTILSSEEQILYWKEKVVPLFEKSEPDQLLFSFLKNTILIGYGGLTYLDWDEKSAEVSFLLDSRIISNKEKYQTYFKEFLVLLKQVAFNELSLHRLYTETFDIRPDHIETLEKCGFQFQKRIKNKIQIGDRLVDSLIHECRKNEI